MASDIDAYISSWQRWNTRLSSKPAITQPLSGGTRNQSWLLQSGHERLVLKIYAEHSPAKTNKEVECSSQRHVAGLGLAARLAYIDPECRFSVSEFIEAQHPGREKKPDKDVLESLVAAINHYQSVDSGYLALPEIDYPAILSRYWNAILAESTCPAVTGNAFEQALARAEHYQQNSGGQRTLVHHDLVPENVLVQQCDNGPACFFLDWEFAGIGIPSFDFAALAVELQLDIQAFAGIAQIDIEELVLAAAVYRDICRYYFEAHKPARESC